MEPVGRIFLAVDLDTETRHAMAAALADFDIPGKVVPPENWHLTLRFVGSTDEVGYERLIAEVDQADLGSGFEVSFEELGAFPQPRRATVLWRAAKSHNDRLSAVAAEIEEACQAVGFEAEERPFRPHLTLARIRPDRDVRPLLATPAPPTITMPVSEVCLFRSHLGGPHARYEVAERFQLH